jgi:hypothetical protein
MKETGGENYTKKSHDTVPFRDNIHSNVLQVEFNNAIKENSSQTLRHASKKVNMEKNQNPRIIPCESIRKCAPQTYVKLIA